jgi:hypothetical protein
LMTTLIVFQIILCEIVVVCVEFLIFLFLCLDQHKSNNIQCKSTLCWCNLSLQSMFIPITKW